MLRSSGNIPNHSYTILAFLPRSRREVYVGYLYTYICGYPRNADDSQPRDDKDRDFLSLETELFFNFFSMFFKSYTSTR